MRTAARLLDVFSAARIVIAVAVEWPSSGIHAPCSVVDRLVEVGRSSVAGVKPASSAAA